MKIYGNNQNDGKHIFVFGSNLAGRHGRGAALQAKAIWGAQTGVGFGRTGQAYAIPTKDAEIKPLTLLRITEFVNCFLKYARNHPELIFLVTRIGCGLAGYTDADIAPMFANSPANCELPDGWEVRRGIRSFACSNCSHKWDEASRDHRSPSVETCPNCDEETSPCDSLPAPWLKTDDMGNLA